MSSEFNSEELGMSEIIEGIKGLVIAPIILTVTAGVNQPPVQSVIKEGIALSERCQEAIAETRERLEDLVAEAQADLAREQTRSNREATTTRSMTGQSNTATEIMNLMNDLSEAVRYLSNGVADLRLLMPIGFGALALRQLIDKGLELDEIPWHTFAWYAFDSFIKLNNVDGSQDQTDSQISTPQEAWTSPTGETL